ncbi:BON domain-containing protein [Oxynema sp. CENA135]|jgi:osmotically-inducible protein OsmY|uniref:BON domain-containing protein n=1 Tax=Oxynema sp. CENA135 TaxID=984206 RepID=UPI0019096A1D|nr:BON domain-containing protein [Oxynema sp. CENA135]MBK4731891.1 BON domain-containing protein [Oxynema sp. CENA135]
MGWLNRIFDMVTPGGEPETIEAPPPDDPSGPAQAYSVPKAPEDPSTPPERLGLNGEYDQSGLAKRVALALDQNPDTDDFERLWVAQTGGTVVLKGEVPSQEDLDRVVNVASGVYGATGVNTDEVTITG